MSFFSKNIKFDLSHIEKDKEYIMTICYTNANIKCEVFFCGSDLIKFINQFQSRQIFMINFPDKNKNIIIVRSNICFLDYRIVDIKS